MATDEPTSGRCGARIRNGDDAGRYCAKSPMRGQARCNKHGGAAPQNRKAAERRLAEEKAQRHVAKYGQPVDDADPIEAAQLVLRTRLGNLAALRDLIVQTEPEALVWGPSETVHVGAAEFPGVNRTEAAGISPLVELYERQLTELGKVAHDQIKLGVLLRAEQRDREVGEFLLAAMLRFAELCGLDPAAEATLRAAQRAMTDGLGVASAAKAIEATP